MGVRKPVLIFVRFIAITVLLEFLRDPTSITHIIALLVPLLTLLNHLVNQNVGYMARRLALPHCRTGSLRRGVLRPLTILRGHDILQLCSL
ncbi:hypothetical protein PAXINDRAFT_171147 [Paxillus involutus ATCC 200175]|uniref:Uncharacterized protein n=1 Tax=Paxillus involutus ATCC 200175 TaxID=664439 RepID=A0A0C9TYB9_PAXIN|nr:hypothetical protein PAXINDRAFT_171147 [Paxillus involutus ATCC 200175]